MKLATIETDLIGNWIIENGSAVADATCLRIKQLIGQHLRELARDASGWNVLYRDPEDNRLWELSYPQGEMH